MPNLSSFANEADYLLFDDFSLTGLLNGMAPKVGPGGLVWQEKNFATSGPATSPGFSVVTADGLTSNQTVAAGVAAWNVIELAEAPGEIGFTFKMADTANVYTPTVGCWTGGIAAQVGLLHTQIGNFLTQGQRTHLIFSTAYYKGNAGVQPPTWNDGGSGYASVLFTPGMLYTFRAFINAPWVYQVLLDATGNVIGDNLVLIEGIDAFIGRWIYLETFNTNLVYRSVWCRKQSPASLNIRSFLGGVDNTPIGLRGPSAGRFTSVLVGNPDSVPGGVFNVSYDGSQGIPGVESFASADAGWEVRGKALGLAARSRLTNFLSSALVTRYDNNSIASFNAGVTINPDGTESGGTNFFGIRPSKTPYLMTLPDFVDDSAAATGGVGIGELYRTGSVVKQRQS